EDGIRDLTVTGVQTCALPICRGGQRPDRARVLRRIRRLDQRRDEWQVVDLLQRPRAPAHLRRPPAEHADRRAVGLGAGDRTDPRSEERRVGKERRSRWAWETE